MAPADVLEPADLGIPAAPAAMPQSEEEDPSLEAVERRHVLRILERVSGDVTMAATILQIGRTTLYQRLKLWGVRGQDLQ